MGCNIYTSEGVGQLTWAVTYILRRGSGNSHGLLHIYYGGGRATHMICNIYTTEGGGVRQLT